MVFSDIIANILSTLTFVFGPIIIILIIISPFILTKIFLKSFNKKRIILCILASIILAVLVGIGLMFLIDWAFGKVGEAIFNSYN